MEKIIEEPFDMDKLIQAVKAQVLSPQVGDVICVQISESEFSKMSQYYRPFVDHLSALFPANVVLVLPNDITLSLKSTEYVKELRAACDTLLSQNETFRAVN